MLKNFQAAALAYSYLISESNNMIDSLIIHRQVDHTAEISQGLNLGLWTTSASSSSPENARSKKLSWNIYKYMDTSLSNSQQVHWYLQLVVPEAGDSLFLLTATDFTTKFPVQLED